MRRALFGIIALALCLCMLSWRAPHDEKPSDSELLGKAIEYFQSGKFHEALLLFDKLDNRYKLNPRFRAFLAVCYYYDWDDEKTCELLDSLIPQLEPFAPHERSIYHTTSRRSTCVTTTRSRMLSIAWATAIFSMATRSQPTTTCVRRWPTISSSAIVKPTSLEWHNLKKWCVVCSPMPVCFGQPSHPSKSN